MPQLKADEKLLVIIGPSGSGKSSAIQQLAREGMLEVTPSWTTRPPRPGELESGLEHRFVSDETLDERKANGYFLEVVEMFGLPFRYALPHVESTKPKAIPTVMLRAQLLPLLKKHYSNLVIYELEDVRERVTARLKERSEQGEALGSRLEDYDTEVTAGHKLANRVIVNSADLEEFVATLKQAVQEDFR